MHSGARSQLPGESSNSRPRFLQKQHSRPALNSRPRKHPEPCSVGPSLEIEEILLTKRVQACDGLGKHERLKNDNAERSSCCLNPAPNSAAVLSNQPGPVRLQVSTHNWRQRGSPTGRVCAAPSSLGHGETHTAHTCHSVQDSERSVHAARVRTCNWKGPERFPGTRTHFIDEEAENHRGKVRDLLQT